MTCIAKTIDEPRAALGWIFAGHQMGAAAFGAGLSRTVLATYLPAFFAAGALCIVASLITLAISRHPKPVAA